MYVAWAFSICGLPHKFFSPTRYEYSESLAVGDVMLQDVRLGVTDMTVQYFSPLPRRLFNVTVLSAITTYDDGLCIIANERIVSNTLSFKRMFELSVRYVLLAVVFFEVVQTRQFPRPRTMLVSILVSGVLYVSRVLLKNANN